MTSTEADGYTFESLASGRKKGETRGRPPIYPYDEWFDGQVRTLEQGVHFESSEETFRQTVWAAARSRNLLLKTSTDYEGKVRLQAFEPVGESLRRLEQERAEA
jgi:hypothetical protein